MADKKIDEVTHDDAVSGSEKIPLDDAGTAKYATTGDLKQYVIDQIEALAAAGAVDVDSDGVYILRSGELKPVDAATLAAAILNYGFDKAAVSAISGSEIVGVKDSSTQKTVTLSSLKAWIEDNITISAELDISAKADATTPLATGNYLVIEQGSGNRKLTIASFSDWSLNRFAAFVTALTAAQNLSDSDVLYIVQGESARKCTISQIKTLIGAGDTIAPATTTENKVPQWDSTQKTLKDGLEVVTSISSSPEGTKLPTEGAVKTALEAKGDVFADGTPTAGAIPKWASSGKHIVDGYTAVTSVGDTGSDTNIPTEKAVRTAITGANGVGAPATTTEGYVPQWDSTQKTLKNGMPVQTTVRNSSQASNTALASEKAVRDAVDGCVTAPLSHTENAIPLWGAANELKAGKSIVTTLGSSGSNDNIPTEKAVRDAIPDVATTAADGLMSSEDKTKLDNLVDTSAVSEIGAALSDSDTVLVKQTDVLQKKSLLSRFWTYISSKLNTVGLDTLGATTDVTTLNASTTSHGLMPKLDGSTEHFMRGDGTWVAPSGSSDFTGTDGTSAGTHGLVPAPATTDVGKFLNADGTWTTPPSAAGVDIPGATAIDALAVGDLAYFFDISNSGYRKVTAQQILDFIGGTTRYDTIFVPAGAMTPSSTNGSSAGAISFTNTTHDTQAFTNTADTSAEFSVVFPDDWNKLTLKFKALWTVYDSTKAETGQHVKFQIGGISSADGETITTAPTTFVDMADMVDSANELHKTAASSALTLDGTVANGNLVHFMVKRDADYAPTGGTAMPTEALLLGIIVQYGRTNYYSEW